MIYTEQIITNQTIINYKNITLLQSYRTIVLAICGKIVVLGRDFDCSRTTLKYVTKVLNKNYSEIKDLIKQDKYIYDDEHLNNMDEDLLVNILNTLLTENITDNLNFKYQALKHNLKKEGVTNI